MEMLIKQSGCQVQMKNKRTQVSFLFDVYFSYRDSTESPLICLISLKSEDKLFQLHFATLGKEGLII